MKWACAGSGRGTSAPFRYPIGLARSSSVHYNELIGGIQISNANKAPNMDGRTVRRVTPLEYIFKFLNGDKP